MKNRYSEFKQIKCIASMLLVFGAIQIFFSQNLDRFQYEDAIFLASYQKIKKEDFSKVNRALLKEIDSSLYHHDFDRAALGLSRLLQDFSFQKNQPKVGIKLFKKYFPRLEHTINAYYSAQLYIDIARSYDYSDDTANALYYYERAIAIAEENGLEQLNGKAHLNKANILSEMGFFKQAFDGYQKASQVYWNMKDTLNILAVQYGQSKFYSFCNLFEEAKNIRDKSKALAIKTGNYNRLTLLYIAQAKDAKKQGDTSTSITLLRKGLESAKRTRRKLFFKQFILKDLVVTYAQLDSLQKAKALLDTLNTYVASKQFIIDMDNYHNAKKNVAFKEGNIRVAEREGKKHLAFVKHRKSFEETGDAEFFMSQLYQETGNIQAAFMHYKNYAKLKDSITGARNISSLIFYKTLYENAKSMAKMESQKNAIQLLKAQDSIKNQWVVFGAISLLLFFGILWFVRSSITAKKQEKQQELFAQELLKTQEEERSRISREIHDGVGQQLTLLSRMAKNSGQEEVSSLAHNSLEELRSISRGLHPNRIAQLGLTRAIKALVKEVDANTPILFDYTIDDIDAAIPEDNAVHLYRIIQEALSNVIKHSKATSCSIVVERAKWFIKVLIEDNGVGYDHSLAKNATSLGMKTLEERAKIVNGKLSITSQYKTYTKVLLQIDLL